MADALAKLSAEEQAEYRRDMTIYGWAMIYRRLDGTVYLLDPMAVIEPLAESVPLMEAVKLPRSVPARNRAERRRNRSKA